jgi:DNA-binding NarL/FixJ family response regulator
VSASPTVLIVEDHTLLAEGLAAAFRAEGLVVHTVGGPSCDAIVALAHEIQPDLVLLDLMLGDEIGLTIPMIPDLRSTGAEVLVLTGITDRLLLSATLEAGASGFASKAASFDAILERVRNTLDGQPVISEPDRADMLAALREHRAERQARLAPFERLTTRERAVLAALMDGWSAEQIADESFVSIATVRSQIRSILEKLGVRSQLAAVALAHRAEWTRDAGSARAVTIQERADGPSASRM